MKHFLFTQVLFFLPFMSQGQLDATFSFDGMNHLYVNPASFGIQKSLSVKTASSILNPLKVAQLPIKNLLTASIGTDKGFGTGLTYTSSALGYHRYFNLNIPINYQFKLNYSTVALGLSAGVEKIYLRPNFRHGNYYEYGNGPIETNMYNKQPLSYDIGAGVYWNGLRHYLGITITHLSQYWKKQSSYTPVNFYLHAGYRFHLLRLTIIDVDLYPMIEAKANPSSFYLKSLLYIQFMQDQFSLALGHITYDFLIFGCTYRIKSFKVGYIYNYHQNQLASKYRSNHEFSLVYQFLNKKLLSGVYPH